MLRVSLVRADDPRDPLACPTRRSSALVPSQVPLVNRLKVTEPVGVGPLPVTISLSLTTAPVATHDEVVSLCLESWICVAVDEVRLTTVSGSHVAVDVRYLEPPL